MKPVVYDLTSPLSAAVPGAIVAALLSDALALLHEDQDSVRACIEQAAALVGRSPLPSAQLGGLAPWQKTRVAAHIEAELGGPLRVEHAARIARLSPNYFSRAFKVTFGLAFSKYVTARRVERAKLLLLTSRSSICQIAFDCGFSDQAHLSRVLRKDLGATPNAWRRAYGPVSNGSARLG